MYELMDILIPFLESPQQGFHIREIARLLKISPMTARKRLNQLVKKSILTKKKMKLHDEFKVNMESIDFQIESRMHFIKKLLSCGLIEHLEKELMYPEAIYLFGSHAKGDYTKDSDIDLFILSDEKRELNITKFEKLLKKKIQLHIMTNKELSVAKEKNPELINNIINGIRIKGYLEVL